MTYRTGCIHQVFVLLLCALCCGVAQPVSAQGKRVGLQSGMSTAETLRLWGAPEEKIEYETKREELWRYSFGKVTFREGKVSSWERSDTGASSNPQVAEAAGLEADPGKVYVERPASQEDVEVAEILSEIMNELPDSTGVSSTDKKGKSVPGLKKK